MKSRYQTMVAVAVFIALAFVCCVLFHFRLSFLSFDLKDAVMAIGALFFGPTAGLAMVTAVCLIEFVTISTTGVYGLIMNFLSSAAFVCISSLVYSRHRSLGGAFAGIACGAASMVAVMLGANLLITPFYMHCTIADVTAMLPTLLLPFNLTKAVFNGAVVFLLYKPISRALHAAGFLTGTGGNSGAASQPSARRFPVWLPAALIAAATLVFFFFVLRGEFRFR